VLDIIGIIPFGKRRVAQDTDVGVNVKGSGDP
jgi:hypothetical protein